MIGGRRGRRIAVVAISLGMVVAAFAFVLPQIASYGAVWRSVQGLTWFWIAGLVVATVANVLTCAPPWMVALPRLGFLRALTLTQAATAFSLLVPGGAPLGMAVSFAALRSWGFAGRPVGLALTLTGIWNQASTFVFPVIAVALLAFQGGLSPSLALVGVVGVLLLIAVTTGAGVVLARPALAYRTGELAARAFARFNRLRGKEPPAWGGESVVRFRAETVELLRRRWIMLTVATLANQLTAYLMLELSLRAVGITQAQISVAESFAAWSVGRLIVSLPLTPGGIGLVELGLTGTLIGFGGNNAKVVAAVLIYRALSILPTLVLGLLAAATWRLQTPPHDPAPSPSLPTDLPTP